MKPKPVHTETVCSVCGLDWDRHSKETLVECVELLKADLAREKLRTTPQPAIPYVPYPVRVPFRPYPNTWINIPQTGGSYTTTAATPFLGLNSGGSYQ